MFLPEPNTLTLTVPAWDGFLAELGLPYPWALVPVADQPLLAHWLDYALDAGYKRVQILGGDEKDALQEWIDQATIWPLELLVINTTDCLPDDRHAIPLTTMPGKEVHQTTVDSAWDLITLRQTLEQERLEALRDDQRVGPNASIAPDVDLQGPYWIGPDVTIETGVHIQPYTVIAAGSVVAESASLADCRLEEKMRIGPFTHLDGHWAGPGFLLNQVKQIQHRHPDSAIVGSLR